MKFISKNKNVVIFSLIFLFGIILRIYFRIGHVFSDDAYYSVLSYNLSLGNFPGDYSGYPVFVLRIVYLAITAFIFKLFGANEFSSIIFPFLVSTGNILLTYKLAYILSGNKNIALTASFLIVFFPTDVIFATINFVDAPNMFFINLGIFYLIKSYKQTKKSYAYLGGLFIFISMQIKENAFYFTILFGVLLFYFLIKEKKLNPQLFIALLFIAANLFIEGFVYVFLHNDFLYRFTTTKINYAYSYYDFFPYTTQKLSGSKNYWNNLFDQIFIINFRSIFLRRFYLFLPIIASLQSFFNIKKKKYELLTFWFIGIVIMVIFFTTSFTDYKPLDLRRSWYVFPALMPAIILSSIFINRFGKIIKYSLLVIYAAASLIMCHQYEIFFDKENLNELKTFLRENENKKIFTDHFTKYSVDLIRGNENPIMSERITGEDFNFNRLNKGEWVLYNKKHIDELKMQNHLFPDFEILKNGKYMKAAAFNDFIFYEKTQ